MCFGHRAILKVSEFGGFVLRSVFFFTNDPTFATFDIDQIVKNESIQYTCLLVNFNNEISLVRNTFKRIKYHIKIVDSEFLLTFVS